MLYYHIKNQKGDVRVEFKRYEKAEEFAQAVTPFLLENEDKFSLFFGV